MITLKTRFTGKMLAATLLLAMVLPVLMVAGAPKALAVNELVFSPGSNNPLPAISVTFSALETQTVTIKNSRANPTTAVEITPDDGNAPGFATAGDVSQAIAANGGTTTFDI
ncbi:MAG: hypothetical protein LBS18_03495, partial [Clostridiales bacterium]|nr:hypothetical protein [Clostridiales bacterium]